MFFAVVYRTETRKNTNRAAIVRLRKKKEQTKKSRGCSVAQPPGEPLYCSIIFFPAYLAIGQKI